MKGLPSRANPRLRLRSWPEGVPAPGLYYRLMRRFFQVTMAALWSVRVFNRHLEPTEGGVVYICNHQSFLDPMLMSLALRRCMNYMARDSLFRPPVFRALIRSLNAFPVRRGQADTAALKEATRRLKAGGQVVVFAEGTRTHDGRIGPLLPGVAMLARRAAKWTVPTVIDGAFECWPRRRKLPLPGNIAVAYDEPIPQSESRDADAEQFMADVRGRMIRLQGELRHRLGREPL